NQIRQVLVNLVMNGLQAMDRPGVITLRIDRAPDALQWLISVTDQGKGIAASDLPHIFEPFFTTKPAGEGTGLGLSIVEGIVLEHNGSIQVASEPGKGSTFTVK